MEPQLGPVEQRVLGSLIEKALTTPEYYPLTLKALRNACNQKSNRSPVMSLDEDDVFIAISSLRRKGLVESVYADGSRVERFRHLFTELFPVTTKQLAVVCELLIRGPQTPGELNSRCRRMTHFASSADAEGELNKLADMPRGAMVIKLPRKPGQKDSRWTHLFSDPEESLTEVHEQPAASAAPSSGSRPADGRSTLLKKTDNERILHLEHQVESMRREIRALSERFDGLRKHLDELTQKAR